MTIRGGEDLLLSDCRYNVGFAVTGFSLEGEGRLADHTEKPPVFSHNPRAKRLDAHRAAGFGEFPHQMFSQANTLIIITDDDSGFSFGIGGGVSAVASHAYRAFHAIFFYDGNKGYLTIRVQVREIFGFLPDAFFRQVIGVGVEAQLLGFVR